MSASLPESDKERFTALVKRLPHYLTLTRQLLVDPKVPATSKAFLAAGGAYAVSPIDLIPGIIPVAGQLDDAWVLLMGVRQSLRSMPRELADAHLEAAGVTWQDIDDDIALVVGLAKRIGRALITTGVQIGRAGRATFHFANDTVKRVASKARSTTGTPPTQ
ncbi:MAG: DUF1232 domain-containing protein [Thermomicrobiales bacterium]|nr:DUF1232 domain-containing protein [Thermomicrobiales bacterium]MCO5219493.1 DUF1232 domain-containing protein [Thermomicrobiales bacterium]MCO5224893.1 DUF1232 domain-containing protein [Thermomicrobiales bacterium]MCO5228465.1 DUF1232 domain-containing protein [Thermomicrobiales bacterium]